MKVRWTKFNKMSVIKVETVRHKMIQQDEVHRQTGREGLGASGGSRFGVELSPGKSGLHQPPADSNWS